MEDYYEYLPDSAHASIWGCSVEGIGFSRVPPGGGPYPRLEHPQTHHFVWKNGRILQSFAILLISEGQGVFEYGSPRKSIPISAGSVMTLFPGVWHRYAPSDSTGWTEHWMICRGAAFSAAAQTGILPVEQPIVQTQSKLHIPEAFHRAHALVSHDPLSHLDILATIGLNILGAIADLRQNGPVQEDTMGTLVRKSQAIMMSRYDSLLNVESLAKELNTSYSSFRRAFKERIGVSPKQYFLKQRIARAQNLLANTDDTVEQISDLLGFSSAFHFSKQFKSLLAVSPTIWRARTRPDAKSQRKARTMP